MPITEYPSTIYNEYEDEDNDIGNSSNTTKGDNYFINYFGKINDVVAKVVSTDVGDYVLEIHGFLKNDDNTKDRVDI